MRNPRFVGVTGSPGAGKSTYVANAVRTHRGNAIVIKHTCNIDDDAFMFLDQRTIENYRTGKARIPVMDLKEYRAALRMVQEKFRNGILVIDDATIFEDGKLCPEMNHLVAMRRHYGIDIWVVYHGFSAFPIDQYKFLNFLAIFNTNDEIAYKKNKIPQYDDIRAAMHRARNRFKTLAPKNPDRYKPEIVIFSM